ncbi:4'-phosphopantetheinyl transferase superfamily protein [Bifidobacterium sp. ESL0690]|uniref:4'-phosphopantetheinyl transferase family protein n=1 Tax=Bifidobacterium sp. ESL0690 TaxID=2983214 RepID=UPI0023F7B56D|nr:4'-phosphopantetheinyl transferase superfamily protein [Bifidobacterium sp. ESL0690]WEV47404.1 4'-phosphopantetheinyl transferase superfamily protein [Bifidobacterium sp. ESL0690]
MNKNISEQDVNGLFAPLLKQGCTIVTSEEIDGLDHIRDEERTSLRHATPKRRTEFLTGRECAHLALQRLHRDGPVLRGHDGAPIWPEGIVGSLSHCPTLSVAAVDFDYKHTTLGVDVEEDSPLPQAAFEAVFSLAEQESDRQLTAVETKACFCAKEAVFKAYNASKYIGDCRRVTIRLKPDGIFNASTDRFHCSGQWTHFGHLIAAMTMVPA